MNTELEKIRDTWAKKTEAKAKALAAAGEARLAEKEGRDPAAFWNTWERNGIEGQEKRLSDEHLALADKYVADHPEEFTEYENKTLEELVGAVSVLRAAGMDEAVQRIEVWLRHHFEPQNIGGEVRARVRLPGLGGKGDK
jgi:hypothetical protein